MIFSHGYSCATLVDRWRKVPGRKKKLSEHSTRSDHDSVCVYSADSAVFLISVFSRVKNLDTGCFLTKMTLNWLLDIGTTLNSDPLPAQFKNCTISVSLSTNTAARFVLFKAVRTES